MADALPTEAPQTDAASTDLGCPGCGYNLRGLPALDDRLRDLVDCPECGLRSDRAKLSIRQWDRPWYKAPGLRRIALPAWWLVLGVPVGLTLFAAGAEALRLSGQGVLWLGITLVMCLIAGWVGGLSWVSHRFDGWVGVWYSLVAHLVLFAYIAGLASLVAAILLFFAASEVQNPSDSRVFTINAISVLVSGVIMLLAGQWGDRCIAQFCIRHFLRRTPCL